jgi:hypothetical protein
MDPAMTWPIIIMGAKTSARSAAKPPLKSRGATPITVYSLRFRRIVLPTTEMSAPNAVRQNS